MPIVTIEYDDQVVPDDDMREFCNAIQEIVATTTSIEDVSVYAHSARIKVKCAPIEVFVRISAHKCPDLDALFVEVKKRILLWKSEQKYQHPINLTIIPMTWKFEVGI
jgi:hypothetical protein